MAEITPETVKHVAKLAYLRLEGRELEQLASQLDQILTYVRQLQAVSTEGVEPTSHVLPLTNVLRNDTPRPSLPQEAVMAMAPSSCFPYVVVPTVIETE